MVYIGTKKVNMQSLIFLCFTILLALMPISSNANIERVKCHGENPDNDDVSSAPAQAHTKDNNSPDMRKYYFACVQNASGNYNFCNVSDDYNGCQKNNKTVIVDKCGWDTPVLNQPWLLLNSDSNVCIVEK